MEWDGSERRKVTADHDILIDLAADMRYLVRELKAHIVSDGARCDKIEKRLFVLERAYYIAVGVLVVVQIFIGTL